MKLWLAEPKSDLECFKKMCLFTLADQKCVLVFYCISVESFCGNIRSVATSWCANARELSVSTLRDSLNLFSLCVGAICRCSQRIFVYKTVWNETLHFAFRICPVWTRACLDHKNQRGNWKNCENCNELDHQYCFEHFKSWISYEVSGKLVKSGKNWKER